MTIKYGLQFFFFELTDNDGQNFLAGIVLNSKVNVESKCEVKMGPFYLKKQRWHRFPVFPEVPPF
jgi:hypothetical protein